MEEALPVWRSTPDGTGADWNSPLEWASAAARRKLIGLVGAARPAAFIWSGGRDGAWGIYWPVSCLLPIIVWSGVEPVPRYVGVEDFCLGFLLIGSLANTGGGVGAFGRDRACWGFSGVIIHSPQF